LTTASGSIEADFSLCNGQTHLSRLFCTAPLKIAKTFPLAGAGLSVIVMDASPGLLAGDHYRMAWRLESGARVEIETQGFTRVHPSRERPCTLETHLEVATGAHLEWHPQPTVLYRDADLRAETVAHLEEGATLLASEIWCAGRVERGEAFAFASFCNRWRVYRNGAPIFASSLDLQPELPDPRAASAFGDWTHAGNFWVWHENANAKLLDALWEVLKDDTSLSRSVYAGASGLAGGGVMVSLLGRRAHDLQEMIALLRVTARRHLWRAKHSKEDNESQPF